MIALLCLLLQDFTVIDSGGWKTKPPDDAHTDRIADGAALTALWNRLPSANRKKEMPKVDFARNMVIAVIPSPDADRKQLRIESVKEENGILTLTYSLTPLAVEGGPGLRLPYVLVEVVRSNAPVHVVEILRDPAGGKPVQERTVKKLEALK